MKKIFLLLLVIVSLSGCSLNQSSKRVEQKTETANKEEQASKGKDIIKFNGRDFKLRDKENINNGVAFYYSETETENTESEIIINAYNNDIKADVLARDIKEDSEKRGNKIYSPFNSPDKNNNDAYYITSLAIYYPDEPYADIYIMKIFNSGRTYAVMYRESLPGVGEAGLELIADTWLQDNLEIYGKAIDEIDPQPILADQKIQERNDGIFIEDDQSNNPDLTTVSAEDVDLNTIPEETFSDDQLKSYYASYNNPYVVHVRKALDGYSTGTNVGMDIPEAVMEKRIDGNMVFGLSAFDKDYYKSKFIVWQIDDHAGGGKDITLIFQDKPDRIFHAWVYQLGDESGEYDLRGFWEDEESSKGIKILLKAYGKYIMDKTHNL